MDNNASNNSSNNNLSPNNIVRSHEPSHNTYDSDSDSSIRTTQEIFIRMRGRTQSKQAAQPSSSQSHTRHALHSIEHHNESHNESRTRRTSCSIERFSPEQLYLLVHKLGDDIWEIKDELKHLRGDPEKNLSAKVFDNVYTNVVKRLFPNHIYPSQCELKETMKEYMNKNFPEFVRNIGEVEFTNRFHNTWCAQLLLKMKNYRGAASQNVHSSIWKVFGCEKLQNNATATEIVKWKESEQVAQCFRTLFEYNDNGVLWITIIARSAFSIAAVPILTNHHCAFTLVVCDIILNPRSRTIVYTEKRMKYCLEQYLTDFENNGPYYESAESIMNNKLSVQSHNTKQSREVLPETELSRNNSDMFSQEENDDLFGVNE
ncbi:hypothetical protein C2G38_2243161 [Gigaspora rosea]|uniref:Uncharacterized protein n=1 Tax=Gigaspora rosea TaxID=44941 RepID=A0A397VJL0_9GLOM|nr:hypothetical protein C2G38_2243161 [Gigaspora rosea]